MFLITVADERVKYTAAKIERFTLSKVKRVNSVEAACVIPVGLKQLPFCITEGETVYILNNILDGVMVGTLCYL